MAVELIYSVEVGWSGAARLGLFTIGTSAIGQADTLGFEFDAAIPGYGGPNDEVTSECKSFQITRGADDNLEGVIAGSAEFTLIDRGNGKYNPLNSGSPIAGQIRPLRPVRIAAYAQTTPFSPLISVDLFNGFLREGGSNPDFGVNEANFQAVDLMVWIERLKPVIAATGQTTVGAAINLILDTLPWPATYRSIAIGSTIPNFQADGSKSGIQLIQELLVADRGKFFISRKGWPTYRARNYRDMATTIGAVDVTGGAFPGIKLDAVKNRATVAATYPGGSRTGALQQTVDLTSADEFGYSDADPIESDYLMSDADAKYLANFLVFRLKNPLDPVWAIDVVEATSSGYSPMGYGKFLAQLELQDVITTTILNKTGEYHIEKIVQTGKEGSLHMASLGLTPRDSQRAFTIGSSTIEGSDILVY